MNFPHAYMHFRSTFCFLNFHHESIYPLNISKFILHVVLKKDEFIYLMNITNENGCNKCPWHWPWQFSWYHWWPQWVGLWPSYRHWQSQHGGYTWRWCRLAGQAGDPLLHQGWSLLWWERWRDVVCYQSTLITNCADLNHTGDAMNLQIVLISQSQPWATLTLVLDQRQQLRVWCLNLFD